jgi:DNA polymerase III alpha subunit|tara:strand:+ start:6323 stop:7042 length:720 start_codon:yes stop_codon:yes gene_type:complete
MIPVFTSHYSFGKSILTLELPSKTNPNGARSIFSILEEQGREELFLLENSMTGFPEAVKNSDELGVQLVYGIQLAFEGSHKINVFARNSKGCKRLNKIYSQSFEKEDCCCDEKILEENWNEKDLLLVVPFYDSFIHQNLTNFDACAPNLLPFNPLFFLQDNGLPFDDLVRQTAGKYASDNKLETQEVKSILYEKKEDVEVLQTYKCICTRKFGKSSLSKPNLDHFGSNEFCFESFKEKQ